MKNKTKVQLGKGLVGIIVKVYTIGRMDQYTLDNGYTWGDSAGRHQQGDKVEIKPYIMGTVTVTNFTKG